MIETSFDRKAWAAEMNNCIISVVAARRAFDAALDDADKQRELEALQTLEDTQANLAPLLDRGMREGVMLPIFAALEAVHDGKLPHKKTGPSGGG